MYIYYDMAAETRIVEPEGTVLASECPINISAVMNMSAS
jgi:hypothetical protein